MNIFIDACSIIGSGVLRYGGRAVEGQTARLLSREVQREVERFLRAVAQGALGHLNDLQNDLQHRETNIRTNLSNTELSLGQNTQPCPQEYWPLFDS